MRRFLSAKLMKFWPSLWLLGAGFPVLAAAPDVAIPDDDAALIRKADLVEVVGTNDLGGPESFTIHDRKAILQFIEFLTDERYTAVPKALKPQFKSLSTYDIRLSAQGTPVFQLRVRADSILDLPNEPFYYLESDAHSDNLMAPLLRLR